MNTTVKKTLLAVSAIVLVAASFSSCKKDKITSDDTMKAIAEQYVNHTVAPTYTNLASKTEQLVLDLQALRANPSQANLDKACNTFLDARAWWEKSEAFLFGAAGDYGIDPHIDSWPLDVDAFNIMMSNSDQITAMDGDEGDVYAGNVLGNALLGFHGIEYILFENGVPKTYSAITDNQLIYAIAVAGDLRNRCYQLEVCWVGAGKAPAAHVQKLDDVELPYTVSSAAISYGENMINAGQAGSLYSSLTNAMMEILDGCSAIADEVGTSKIGKPYSGDDPDYIESPYSQKSIIDFYNNIISIQNAYYGGVEGQRDDSKSLHSYIADIDADLDKRVTDAITNALSKISAMPAPFVNNRTAAANGQAVKACQALDEVLSEAKAKIAEL